MKSSPSSSEGALTSLHGLDLPLNRGGTVNSRRSNGDRNACQPTLDSFLANLGDPGRFQVRIWNGSIYVLFVSENLALV